MLVKLAIAIALNAILVISFSCPYWLTLPKTIGGFNTMYYIIVLPFFILKPIPASFIYAVSVRWFSQTNQCPVPPQWLTGIISKFNIFLV